MIISRHGGPFLSKWWLDELYQYQTIQIEILPENLPYIDNHTVVYVKIQDTDVKTMCDQFLINIVGRVHVQCVEHRLPLISSMDIRNKCECGKKYHYRCCEFHCNFSHEKDVFLIRVAT